MTIDYIKERITANYNAHVCIPRPHLADEVYLLTRKWPAYRFLAPTEATTLFIEAYKAARKDMVWRTIDRDTAERMTSKASLDTTTNNAHFTQMWRARMQADKMGLPYYFYLNFCFDFHALAKRRYAPQQNQLGFTSKSKASWEAKMQEAWGEDGRKLALDRMEVMAEYCIDNDNGLPAQKAFREELLDSLCNSCTNIPTFIGKRVISLRQLSADQCRSAFNAEIVDAAVANAKSDVGDGLLTIHSYDAPGTLGMLQSCLGLPAVDRATSDICNMCSQVNLCSTVRDEVTNRLMANHGTDDPIRAKQLTQGRAYTAKCRAKAEAAKLAPPARPASGATI